MVTPINTVSVIISLCLSSSGLIGISPKDDVPDFSFLSEKKLFGRSVETRLYFFEFLLYISRIDSGSPVSMPEVC